MQEQRDDFRVATFAVPLSGNKGSASMLLGLRDAFIDNGINARISVFSYYPERDAEIASSEPGLDVFPGHPRDIAFGLLPAIARYRMTGSAGRRWGESVRALVESDMVLLMGGTTFADSMLYKVPWNLLAALPAYWLKRPAALLSQTIGPSENLLNRWALRWVQRRAAVVHGRGRTSADWANKVGGCQAEYWPDLSFPMHVPEFGAVAAREPIVAKLAAAMRASGKPAIGIAPNSIVLEKSAKAGICYVSFLVEVTRELHSRGFLPILIPHSYRVGEAKQHNNDRSLCENVLAKLSPNERPFYIDADLDSRDLRAVIGQLHLLVASRFHSMVSALSMGVPPVTFGWGHHKYSEVLTEFNAADLYASYQEMTLSRFRSLLSHALDNYGQYRADIARAATHVRKVAGTLPAALAEHVGKTLPADAPVPLRKAS